MLDASNACGHEPFLQPRSVVYQGRQAELAFLLSLPRPPERRLASSRPGSLVEIAQCKNSMIAGRRGWIRSEWQAINNARGPSRGQLFQRRCKGWLTVSLAVRRRPEMPLRQEGAAGRLWTVWRPGSGTLSCSTMPDISGGFTTSEKTYSQALWELPRSDGSDGSRYRRSTLYRHLADIQIDRYPPQDRGMGRPRI